MSHLAPITVAESKRLIALEKVIQAGKQTFIEVGNALIEIRDKRLYKAEFKTFEEYGKVRWDMSSSRVRQFIGATQVVGNLESVTNVTVLPSNESQTRPLASLEPEQQRGAWADAVETAGGKQPTAKQVAASVEKVRAPAATGRAERIVYKPSNGLQYADQAISCLEHIQPGDTQRTQAFQRVIAWIKKQKGAPND